LTVVVCSANDSGLFTDLLRGGLAVNLSFTFHPTTSDRVLATLGECKPAALIVGVANSCVAEMERAIRSVRGNARHGSLPIVCASQENERAIAEAMLTAGATEVFAEKDLGALLEFVGDLVHPAAIPQLSGSVLLIEDSEEYAAYLIDLCEEVGLATELVTTVGEAIPLLDLHSYDLVVTDVVLKDTQSGLAVLRYLRALGSPNQTLPVIVISAHDDPVRRAEAFRSGADGFLRKPFVQGEFLWYLRKLLKPGQEKNPNRRLAENRAKVGTNGTLLTARETEICSGILLGMSDKSIAAKHGISFWTVRTHIQRIFEKLDVNNRRELIAKFRSDD
jgi:DNA-binding NarL/FixJ family response regulator